MLLKRAVLEQIRNGEITLVFRCWRRPTVKTGGRLRTAIGVLGIDDVRRVSPAEIRKSDAVKAGFADRQELLAALDTGRAGDIYRIQVHYQGEDERVQLRQQSKLDAAAFEEILQRLEQFDARSRRGPWTHAFLKLIHEFPEVHAEQLASRFGSDKPWFKRNVRKLKELGLTESLSPGYRLSPRGAQVLKKLPK